MKAELLNISTGKAKAFTLADNFFTWSQERIFLIGL